ncbi:hypothetical protein GX441_04565 [bacterium]|nr:hypothetical protein [bacterium]
MNQSFKFKAATILFGLLLAFTIVNAAADMPKELQFLTSEKPPDYLSIMGTLEAKDSSGVSQMLLPYFFYWEKGSFIFDIRSAGGGPAGFFKGVADTIWICDFIRGVKLTTLLNQKSGYGVSIPFSPEDILSVFNLLPGGVGDIDTFYNQENKLVIKAKSGNVYEYDAATHQPISIQNEASRIVFKEFAESGSKTWPKEIELYAGSIIPGTNLTVIKTTDVNFKRNKNRELLEKPLPFRMNREFDIRSQFIQNQ